MRSAEGVVTSGNHAECGIKLENLADCDDTRVMVKALRDMPYEINIGAAGTAMRFLTAYLSTLEGEEHVITGSERMQHRPIRVLVDALRACGANIEYTREEGYPPLRIKGTRLEGGTLTVDGSISSQYISALLMIAPRMVKGLDLQLTGRVVSQSYIDMTKALIEEFSQWGPENGAFVVESDWSAASYWYQIMALTQDEHAELELIGLQQDSLQADSAIEQIMIKLEAYKTESAKVGLGQVCESAKFSYDFTLCPDIAQTVVCTCCGLGVPFHFTGLSTLKIKETDRIEALKTELKKLGFVIQDRNDSELIWDGERCEATMEAIDTYDDHRMAMAFAPLCLVLGEIKINNPEVVSKSYPNFWDHLKIAGFEIKG